jgi:hypothetical protein
VPLSPSSSTVASLDAVQGGDHLFQPGILTDDLRRASPLRKLLLQQEVLGGQPALHERAFDHQEQVIWIDRLGKEVHRAVLHGGDGVLDAAVRGHDDDRHVGVELFCGAEHAEAIALRQPEVRENQAGATGPQDLQGLLLIPRLDDGVPLRLEGVPEHRAQRVLVLDQEDWRIRDTGRH